MFGTSGIRGPIGETVTADLALTVGRALVADGSDRIVVGRDPRTSGALLVDALTAGIREAGGTVFDLGQASTPTIARQIGWLDADAGVAITASHNPPRDNGIKLWTPSGQAFDAQQRERMTELITEQTFLPAAWDALGDRQTISEPTAQHKEAILDSVPPIDELHVVVDLGTGMGGLTVEVLRELGCTVETLNEQPDGRFPARPSEPTAEHCGTLQATVANTDADLGIAHDGDADRMRAVAEDGTFLSGDVLLALFARQVVSAGDQIAAPVNTSLAVDDLLETMGATVTRTKVGDVFVAERTRDTGVVFGGEPSGAWIWPDETLCPDGHLAAAKLAALVDREGPLSSLTAIIDEYPLHRESVEVDDKHAVMEQLTSIVETRFDAVDRTDGLRISVDDGWLLVRASGTQPLIRLTAEARDADRAAELRTLGEALLADARSDE